MSVQAMSWAFEQRLPSTPKFVLVALANYANSDEARCTCFPGQKTLARDTSLDERTVRRSLKFLEEMGFIDRMRRRRDDGTRTSDEVTILINRTLWPVAHQPDTQSEPTGPCVRAINRKVNRKEKEKRLSVEEEGSL